MVGSKICHEWIFIQLIFICNNSKLPSSLKYNSLIYFFHDAYIISKHLKKSIFRIKVNSQWFPEKIRMIIIIFIYMTNLKTNVNQNRYTFFYVYVVMRRFVFAYYFDTNKFCYKHKNCKSDTCVLQYSYKLYTLHKIKLHYYYY